MSNTIDLTKVVTIRVRRDASIIWQQKNPILKNGEPGLETDTKKIKFGDGVSQWNDLSYSGIDVNDPLLIENIDDRVSALIKGGSNISIVYSDNLNELTISAVGLQMAGDYATLVDGTIPASQLPSYVDDVLEFSNAGTFPSTGEVSKIYVALDSNKTYRWSGSTYIEISASPGSTDAVPEGSVNKYYTDSRASAAAPVQSVAGRTGVVTLSKSDVGLGNVDNTTDANKPISTATQTALDLKAPIANPTFTGTVSGVTKSMVGLGNVDNTSDVNKPVSTAQASADTAVQNAAATDATSKANAAQAYAVQRANHTGTQAISTVDGLQSALDSKQPSGNYATLVDGTVPSSQLPSYVDDVLEFANLAAFPLTGEVSKIYIALDSNKTYRWSGSTYIEIGASPGSTDAVPEGSVNKYYTDSRASAAAPVQSVAGRTGVVTLSKSDVGLGNVDNTTDANKPISTATQTALDLKAPIANPTFTGTVSGVTKSMVGLGNVDNTSDVNKPVSTAQASADTAVQNAAASDATAKANAAQAYSVQRSNHTGTQSIGTVNGLQTALDGKSAVGHTHTASNITDFNSSVSDIVSSSLSTDILAGASIGLDYNNINDTLTIYNTHESYITSLGSVSGNVPINYDPKNRSIQTVTLNGTATTFIKGIGWPIWTDFSTDVILKITVTSPTTVTWSIITEWYNQPPVGALTIDTHLILIRAIGNSVIEGHYIGRRTL